MYFYTFCIGAEPKIFIHTLVLGAGPKICIPTLFVLGAGPKIGIPTLFVLSVNLGGPIAIIINYGINRIVFIFNQNMYFSYI